MDPVTITTIGALVGITKSVIDTFKSLGDLLDSRDTRRIERESQSELEKVNENFAKLRDLDRTVTTISPGNIDAFKGDWGTITTQFNNLRNTAEEMSRSASDVQGALIRELRDSAKE